MIEKPYLLLIVIKIGSTLCQFSLLTFLSAQMDYLSCKIKRLCGNHLELFYEHTNTKSTPDYQRDIFLKQYELMSRYSGIDACHDLIKTLGKKHQQIIWLLLQCNGLAQERHPLDYELNWYDLESRFIKMPLLQPNIDGISTLDSAYHSEEDVEVVLPEESNKLRSWERPQESHLNRSFITENIPDVFSYVYEEFVKTPVIEDQTIVGKNSLITKLLNLANGIESDLFHFENNEIKSNDFRINSCGYVSMKKYTFI